jgi:hypothetical protein
MNYEEEFKKIVKEINWSADTDVDMVKLSLMKRYTYDQIVKIEEVGTKQYKQLSGNVQRYESLGKSLDIGSGDGFHDLLSHVIGEGEESVNAHCFAPYLLQEKYDRGDYTENFYYVFPSENDYKMLTLDYYTESTARIREIIGEPSNMDEHDVLDVCAEIEAGDFNNRHTYKSLTELSNESGIMSELGYLLPNIWSDGRKFYGK